MDLFEDYHLLPEELKAVCDKWQEKSAYWGLDYNDCEIFQKECEAIGYTFDYGLDAEPFDLRPINLGQQLQDHITNNQDPGIMRITNDLSWYDKNITPLTRAYKDFVKEKENTSPEHFFQDGERVFTAKEIKFLKILDYKSSKNKINASYPESREPVIENSGIAENRALKLDELKDMFTQYYEKEQESMFDFTHPKSIKTLELALFLQNADEPLKKEVLTYIFTEPPLQPDFYDFMDDSYDRGESSYEKAKESYEIKIEKYNLFLENAYSVFDRYNFDIHMVHESNVESAPDAFKVLIHDLSNQFSAETKAAIKAINADQSVIHANNDRKTYEMTSSPQMEKNNPHVETTIEGYSSSELMNLSDGELENLLKLKKEQYKIEQVNDDIIAMSFIDSQIKRLLALIHYKSITNNQNPNIMETTKEFDQVQYLKDQLKYLGFGEDSTLHKDLEKGIESPKQQFEIKAVSDKALPGNTVDFSLKFNKSENGGVFFNSYQATLKNEKNESFSHNFYVSKESTFTAKEAVNLLEGRSVKIEFHNPKTDQVEPAFVKLDFKEPKTEKGNYNFQNFYKNYGIDTAEIVEKSNLVFDKPEYKENTIKSLEKGNVVKVKFELDDGVIEGKAVLNPQYKNLNLYDQDMNRINTNKPLQGLEDERGHDKANVREQSIKR
ncbi:hypothetical protein KB553_15915 [Chryseobacterium rhizoplanae]|uniref:hypothetical protein n=1 Tax=Chryseobacterium rhizoplanae TaxID=1609531 RepID=UPI001CE28A5A|nr:hypothetical protein [Chryseobacterium rhizoplanae]UCA58527.1 hypothetical protein KB553_15915 [Chryseobacterium rhizoplanae]